MSPILLVAIICVVLFALFNLDSIKWLPKIITRLAIGALLLFFLNILSGSFGLHVPINLFTSAITGFLGFPGIVMISSVFLFVI